jgi:hypothetical protein
MCKQSLGASETYGPLDEDLTMDANLSFKLFHHLAEFFNQLTPAPICIYDWILIQRCRRLACTFTPKSF